MFDPLKKQAEIRGRRAEWRAAMWLRLKGYRLLARGWRVPQGEVDLIIRRGNVVAFVEVKARATLDQAAESITDRQKLRIRNAAERFLMAHPEHAQATARFDAVLIAPRHWPRHQPDAWR